MKFLRLQQALDNRQEQGLTRHRLTIDSPQQTEVVIDNKLLINFSSNDYLGLANQHDAVNQLGRAVLDYGFGSGGSHLICGHQRPHQELETALAQFVERDAAITFSSGYMANLAILQTLAKKNDLIISDKLNHASIIDGCRLSAADSVRFPHGDMAALDKRLKQSTQNKFVVTDSVFSMDGDIAPLKEIAKLCDKYNAILMVDDAHGFGVLGERGQGSAEHFGLNQKQLPVLMATLGKALGGYGAFVAGEQALVDYLVQFGRSYIYTTAMPACVAAANLTNLQWLKANPQLQKSLFTNIDYFKQQCRLAGLSLLPSATAIQPLMVGDNQRLKALNQKLLANGFLVGAIRPPTVPDNTARLRITLSAAHNSAQIDGLVNLLTKEINRCN